MNEDPNEKMFERLAPAWTVDTGDIAGRVAAAIGSERTVSMNAVLEAVRDVTAELADLRRANALLYEEIVRLRRDLERGQSPRIVPYSQAEGAIRIA